MYNTDILSILVKFIEVKGFFFSTKQALIPGHNNLIIELLETYKLLGN